MPRQRRSPNRRWSPPSSCSHGTPPKITQYCLQTVPPHCTLDNSPQHTNLQSQTHLYQCTHTFIHTLAQLLLTHSQTLHTRIHYTCTQTSLTNLQIHTITNTQAYGNFIQSIHHAHAIYFAKYALFIHTNRGRKSILFPSPICALS